MTSCLSDYVLYAEDMFVNILLSSSWERDEWQTKGAIKPATTPHISQLDTATTRSRYCLVTMLSVPSMASQSTASLSISDTDSLYIAVSSLHHELKSYAPEPRGNDATSLAESDTIRGKHCCIWRLFEWEGLFRGMHVCVVWLTIYTDTLCDMLHCVICCSSHNLNTHLIVYYSTGQLLLYV